MLSRSDATVEIEAATDAISRSTPVVASTVDDIASVKSLFTISVKRPAAAYAVAGAACGSNHPPSNVLPSAITVESFHSAMPTCSGGSSDDAPAAKTVRLCRGGNTSVVFDGGVGGGDVVDPPSGAIEYVGSTTRKRSPAKREYNQNLTVINNQRICIIQCAGAPTAPSASPGLQHPRQLLSAVSGGYSSSAQKSMMNMMMTTTKQPPRHCDPHDLHSQQLALQQLQQLEQQNDGYQSCWNKYSAAYCGTASTYPFNYGMLQHVATQYFDGHHNGTMMSNGNPVSGDGAMDEDAMMQQQQLHQLHQFPGSVNDYPLNEVDYGSYQNVPPRNHRERFFVDDYVDKKICGSD